MGIHAPISVSVKDGDMNNLFYRIVNAAEQPHIGVPETEIGKYKKRHRQILNHSLVFVSGIVSQGVLFCLLCEFMCMINVKNDIIFGD